MFASDNFQQGCSYILFVVCGMIGLELLFQFGATEYSVEQDESSVNISVELLTGSLFDYSVTLQATTLNASALGTYYVIANQFITLKLVLL